MKCQRNKTIDWLCFSYQKKAMVSALFVVLGVRFLFFFNAIMQKFKHIKPMKTIIITITSVILLASCSNDSRKKFVCKDIKSSTLQIHYLDSAFRIGDTINLGKKIVIVR